MSVDQAVLESGWTFREAARPGLVALKKYWAPFLLIQTVAVTLVVLYYKLGAVQTFADQIGILKDRYGILFAATGGFFAGGILPEIAKLVTGRIKKLDGQWARDMLFAGLIYAAVASEVDIFYRLQAIWFGTGVDPMTVGLKLIVDMGLFCPILCMPLGIVMVDWRRNRFNPIPTVKGLDRIWYRERVVPALFPGWAFWIPFLCAVYALPLRLQIPLCLLGEAAWSLLYIFIANQEVE